MLSPPRRLPCSLRREDVVNRLAPPLRTSTGLETFGVQHLGYAIKAHARLAEGLHPIQHAGFALIVAEGLSTISAARSV